MVRLPEGIYVGHAQNERTGVTVILAPDGAVGGVDVRGGAPGTRETALLAPEKTVERINAVVLTGGSAYGLESCCGVMNFLREHGKGFPMGDKIVPCVCGAVIYDLSGDGYVYPDMRMGYTACENAMQSSPTWGSVGCGKGATVGKALGPQFADKGGIGAYTVSIGDVFVTAVVAVNACGDVYKDNEIIAGTHSPAGGYLNMRKTLLSGAFPPIGSGQNTTIGCILTNAQLTKLQANKLATAAHNGLARVISPVHTDFDGDTLFALSAGTASADLNVLCIAAVEAVEQAVITAVL